MPAHRNRLTHNRFDSSNNYDLQAAYERIAVDLVDKHEIVARDVRQALVEWLSACIPGYFGASKYYRLDLTDSQAKQCQRNIAKLGDKLAGELCKLYGVASFGPHRFDLIPQDLIDLMSIVSRAQKVRHRRKTPQKDNASKRALQELGDQICCFWMTGWTGRLDQEWDLKPPVIDTSSGYFKFAKYIYAFVRAGAEDPAIKKRLRTANKNLVALSNDRFPQLRAFLQEHRQATAAMLARHRLPPIQG